MKVLKLSILSCLLFSSSTFANENNSDLNKYLSDYKKEQFNYDYKKNEAESSKLHDSWIAPIQMNYSYSVSKPYLKEQTTQNAAIKMNQPIFKSGGIFYAIKYANMSRLYSDYSIDVAKRKMIKDTISILMQIKQTTLQEKRQEFQIANADINLAQQKEQYLNGQLDSGFLDNAIIQRNFVIQSLYDIQTAKEKLITQFSTLSDLDYKSTTVPHLEFLTNEEFMAYNIVIKQNEAEIERNRYFKDITIAKYLPSINFSAGYNWQKIDNQQFSPSASSAFSNELAFYNYGLSASMPLDINTFRDIESSRVDYLKAQVVTQDKKRELNALFEQVMHNIKNFDKKIKLSDENIDIYTRLLADTKDLFDAGYKTEYDLDTLKNSLKIQNIDSKMFEIDKQLELLTLYEMYVNDGQ